MLIPQRLGRTAAALALCAGTTFFSGVAAAQSADPAELLEEFVHYITVAKPDLAIGYGQELLDAGISAAALAALVDEGDIDLARMDRAFERGLRVEGLESIVEGVSSRIEQGRLELARERDRIVQAIEMLDGTLRQKRLGERRLEAAGEYAVPYLLDVLNGSAPELTKQAVRDVLVSIGVQAITPLTVALPHLDPVQQRTVIEILDELAGRGGRGNAYRHAAPALAKAASDDTTTQVIRELATATFERMYGGMAPLDELHVELADMYMSDLGSLVAFPFDPTQNVWSWEAAGLVARPVPTIIFNEVMAMREAADAVAVNADNERGISLYVAANLRRENELPAGGVDPIFGDNPYTPEFYATVFGPGVAQSVLAYALDTTDTPLVRDAITALAKTTGGSNLFPSNTRRPLVEALTYADRRVRLDAALTLARATPREDFAGSGEVVPLLASAVRTGGTLYAAVISDDAENGRVEASRLENLGFTVVAQGPSAADVLPATGDISSLDLVVVRMNDGDDAVQANADLRGSRISRVAPVMLVVPAVDAPRLALEYRADARTAVTRPLADAGHEAAIEDLLRRGAGGRLSGGEAERYAIEALTALRDIAIAGTPAFDVVDAEPALLVALEQRSGGTLMLVADVLALMQSSTAQRALFDAALGATDPFDQGELLARVADSVKRFGNLSEERQVTALVRLVSGSEDDIAEAAARVHGALNRQPAAAVGFIDGGTP
jgi:hypothetical protein